MEYACKLKLMLFIWSPYLLVYYYSFTFSRVDAMKAKIWYNITIYM